MRLLSLRIRTDHPFLVANSTQMLYNLTVKVTRRCTNMSLAQPDGYLAMPAAGKGKPVLVLHAWWGLNDTIKAFCDRLAKEGFVAFALDMYHGKLTDKIEEAEKLVRTVDSNAGG